MRRIMLKSKIHRAKVTEACLEYEGSVTIDKTLMDAAKLIEYEQVDIYNISNGERFHTYVIAGEPGSGEICLNGAAARKASVNDLVIICSYVVLNDEECNNGYNPPLILIGENNQIAQIK